MNLDEKDLDSIRNIEIGGKIYFNVKDLSKIIGKKKPSNLVSGVDKDSIVKDTIDKHRKLFVDSFGLMSIFVKSRSEEISRKSDQVFRYICSKGCLKGGVLNYTLDPPLKAALRNSSKYNLNFYGRDCIPTLAGLIGDKDNIVLIYKTDKLFPLFSITDISRSFNVPTEKLLCKVSIWNREKMVKMDSVTGDRLSWFTGPIGILEIIMKVRNNRENEINRKLFNTLINIVKNGCN
mgnify:CR=1 FL=1|jgi:hypothetical protein